MSPAPRASIAGWLEALVQKCPQGDEVAASAAAIQVASLIPLATRADIYLGEIVMTAAGGWRKPDPDLLFLPDAEQGIESVMDLEHCVHPALASDGETLSALKALGINPPSLESRFKLVAERVLAPSDPSNPEDTPYESFWALARTLDLATALRIIREYKNWPRRLRCQACSGRWRPIYSILLPGHIVPGDGSRDDAVTIDMDFHRGDETLLRELGVGSSPAGGREMKWEPQFQRYLNFYKEQYRQLDDLTNPTS